MTLANNEKMCDSEPASYRIDVVDLVNLPVVWPHILPFLEKSLDNSSPDAIYEALAAGAAKLWIFHKEWVDGFAITSVNGDIGIIEKAGGRNLNGWFKCALKKIEDDFRNSGCKVYQVASRKGWIKMIKPDEIDYLLTKVL
jgi:hypothetical protein